MASIGVLELTSLMGAESSPSTTSSLDISLFFCGEASQEIKKNGKSGELWHFTPSNSGKSIAA